MIEEKTADNNSIELRHAEENKEQLLKFNGKDNGKDAWILLDSGTSRNFIDKKFTETNRLPTKEVKQVTVELADGSEKKINKAVDIKSLQLGEY